MITIAADIDYKRRDEACAHGFTYNWDMGRWTKRLKNNEVEAFIKKLPFKITKLHG